MKKLGVDPSPCPSNGRGLVACYPADSEERKGHRRPGPGGGAQSFLCWLASLLTSQGVPSEGNFTYID